MMNLTKICRTLTRTGVAAAVVIAAGLGVAGPWGIAYGAEKPGSEGDIGRGAKAWAENCMRCHNARDPREFRDDLWKPVVHHMRVRAGLTGQQARDILKYIQKSN